MTMSIVIPGFELRHSDKLDETTKLAKWVHPGTREKVYGLLVNGQLVDRRLLGSQTAARNWLGTDEFADLRAAILNAAAQAKLAAADAAAAQAQFAAMLQSPAAPALAEPAALALPAGV